MVASRSKDAPEAKAPSGGADEPARLGRDRGSGPKFGRYHVLEPLGEGGMARVFLAYDPQLHRRVAIKLLKRPKHEDAAHSSARLVREAQALAQLSHPNLVHVYEVGEQAGEVFVVMEYIRGQTLSQWLVARRRSCDETIAVLAGAGRGLASAHRANIVHRDFKPSNVVIDRDGVARVVDFGIAVLGGGDVETSGVLTETKVKARHAALSLHCTEGGSVMGTPPYMAPEQHLGQAIDARTDQFSFAVTLFEALYRIRPFPDDFDAMLAAKTAGEMRFPTTDNVPGRVRTALRKALSPAPDKRFASMQELLEALESTRRAVWIVVGGAVTIAAVAGAVGLGRTKPDADCDTPPRRIGEVWNDERRAALAQSFAIVESPWAEHSLGTVTAGLDRYSSEWTDTWRAGCRATRIDGTQSEQQLDLRMGCLERSLDGLEALVDVLADADARVVERSVIAVADLVPVAVCGDEPRLRDELPLPDDPRLATAVITARTELARIDALVDAGSFAVALERARLVAADADRLGHAPLVAEAQFALGEALEGDPAAAEAAYRAAILAANVGHHDLVAARAWNELVQTVGVAQSRRDEARSLATGAEAAVARVDADGSLAASLAASLGSIASADGDYDEAIAQYRRAEQLIVLAYGSEDPRLRVFVNNLGVVLLQQGKWSEALAQFERALDQGERSLGADHPYVADYVVNIGLVHLERHDGGSARTMLERALAILEREPEVNRRRIALTRANLGSALYLQGEHAAAGTESRSALSDLERLLGTEHPHVAGVVERLALVAMQAGELEEAERLFARARDTLAASLGPRHPLLAMVHMHHAELALERGQPEAAERMLVEAEAVLREDPGSAHPDHANAVALLAEARIARGATDQDETLSAAIVRLRPLDHHARARARFALARSQWAAGRHDDALVTAGAARGELGGVDELRARDVVGRNLSAWLDAHSR